MGVDVPYAFNQGDSTLNRRFKVPDVLPGKGVNPPVQSNNLHGAQPAARAQEAAGIGFNAGNNVQRDANANFSQANARPMPNQFPVDAKVRQMVMTTLINKYNKLNYDLVQAKSQNGFIGNVWDGVKNLTGLGASSDKVRAELKNILKQKAILESNPSQCNEVYRSLTGKDLNPNELRNLSNGVISFKAEKALNSYVQGQEMAIDLVADVASGVAAFGIYSAAIALSPFTAGASIAIGLAGAAAAGALVKSGIKAWDAKDHRVYNSLNRDLITGLAGGLLAPIAGGIGGAFGKTVAKTLGIEFTTQAGTEVVEQGLIKSILLNPAGYKYAGKALIPFLAELEAGGALFGAANGAFNAAYDGNNVLEATVNGAAAGALGAVFLGLGARGLGVVGGKLAPIVKSLDITGGKLGYLSIRAKSLSTIEFAEYTGGLKPYRQGLKVYDTTRNNVEVLFRQDEFGAGYSPTVLFNRTMPLSQSFGVLRNLSDKYKAYIKDGVKVPFKNIRTYEFGAFERAIAKGKIPNYQIIGMIGQGKDSIALLTSDHTIIKLSTKPNFPSKENFIPGVDVPIRRTFVARDERGTTVYGVEEEFAEVLTLKDLSESQLAAIEADMNRRLARVNPNYKIIDGNDEQYGLIGNKIYLIDHQCVEGRKLYGE